MKDNNNSISLGLNKQNGYITFSKTNEPLMLRKANIEDLKFLYNHCLACSIENRF